LTLDPPVTTEHVFVAISGAFQWLLDTMPYCLRFALCQYRMLPHLCASTATSIDLDPYFMVGPTNCFVVGLTMYDPLQLESVLGFVVWFEKKKDMPRSEISSSDRDPQLQHQEVMRQFWIKTMEQLVRDRTIWWHSGTNSRVDVTDKMRRWGFTHNHTLS
jgi:hypothetical protein